MGSVPTIQPYILSNFIRTITIRTATRAPVTSRAHILPFKKYYER